MLAPPSTRFFWCFLCGTCAHGYVSEGRKPSVGTGGGSSAECRKLEMVKGSHEGEEVT